MRWWQVFLAILGALVVFEVSMRLAKRWIYMRVSDLDQLVQGLWGLIDFDVDGSALNLYPVDSRILVRFEKSSDDHGDYCRLVFSDSGENRQHFSSVRKSLEAEGVDVEIDSSGCPEGRRVLISQSIRSPADAARAAAIAFCAVGVDVNQGLRFKAEGSRDAQKVLENARRQVGPGWWKPWQ